MLPANHMPYCGYPPVPGSTVWNLDLILLVSLAACALAYFAASWKTDKARPSRQELTAFVAGWLAISFALISPLCNLSVALFSARIAQHATIMLVGAPLVVLGRADLLLLRIAEKRLSVCPGRRERVLALPIFATLLWCWHTPIPYDATLRSGLIYWTMHITLFAAALLLWRSLLRGIATNPGPALLASFFFQFANDRSWEHGSPLHQKYCSLRI